MSILIQENTKVLIQGITGKEGQKAAKSMMELGTEVVGGVRPGKGGEEVLGLPVFDTVADAKEKFSDITTSAVYVPPFAAKEAALEAIEAGVPQINIVTEGIPIQDTAEILAEARERDIRIIGPSSLGFISPGDGRVGMIGGRKDQVEEIYQPGKIGIISRSGGMSNELAWQVRQAGYGQSTVVHVGGDMLMGTDYKDLLELFEEDGQTEAVILFGEHGGSYEFEIVELIKDNKFSKPLAVYVGGEFANNLPEGMNIGHAGAIVEAGKGAKAKAQALEEVGVKIADHYEQLIHLVT
ncbi:MAG: CoA-binding protein [Candidatus Magasanikbacteria bacterium]